MAKSDPVADLLAEVDLFSTLTRAELKKVAGQMKAQAFAAGRDIVTQGGNGGRFYLITAGTADVLVNGRYRETLGRGSYLGEISLIDGEPRSATVTATTAVETESLASFNFKALLREAPAIAEKLLVALCHRYRVERSMADAATARADAARLA